MNRWLPWIVALIALAWLSPALRSPRPGDDGFDTSAFGHLPVQVGGRIKPFDTLARNSLKIISGKQVVRQDGHKTGATRWLLDVLFDGPTADITVLAYQAVQVIRKKLGEHGINESWASLREKLARQYRITATFKQRDGKTLHIRQATRPEEELANIYTKLGISTDPGRLQRMTI